VHAQPKAEQPVLSIQAVVSVWPPILDPDVSKTTYLIEEVMSGGHLTAGWMPIVVQKFTQTTFQSASNITRTSTARTRIRTFVARSFTCQLLSEPLL
jgi:hypothetical protein